MANGRDSNLGQASPTRKFFGFNGTSSANGSGAGPSLPNSLNNIQSGNTQTPSTNRVITDKSNSPQTTNWQNHRKVRPSISQGLQ